MPVNLSVRNVPDEIANKLRARAHRNHRSLQGEMLALLEQSLGGHGASEETRELRAPGTSKLTFEETAERATRGLYHPGEPTGTEIIRRDRDRADMNFVGLDGYKKGWVAVRMRGRRNEIDYITNINELLGTDFDLAMIDIPIGLPDRGNRDCDLEAKRLLGSHSSRVFTGARRSILTFATQMEANTFCKANDDVGVAAQLHCLGAKIKEVDDVMTPALQIKLKETHPELVFLRLNHQQPLPTKKRPEGRALRRRLLEEQDFDELDKWLAERIGRGAAEDDILDACACAIAARDYAGRPPPAHPVLDAKGLQMAINF